MPPKSNKRRAAGTGAQSDQTSPPAQPTTPNRNTWPGWCEVESEPAFFNTILHDTGVCGIKIQEVLGLDDELLAILPKPVYAMIFLFRYRETGKEDLGTSCPPHIWFANQVPEYACASVSLLNIVMNIPHLKLGPELHRFKDSTKPLSPVGRGDAIADFEFVRNIHNSFARENDMLNVDSLLKDKQVKLQKRQKMQAANAAKAVKAAERAAQRAEQAATKAANGVRRATPSRRAKLVNPVTESPEPSADDGFHFIGYMPIDDQVWKLDGMDNFPQSLGKISSGVDWLSVVQTELLARMLQYQEGQIQFSLMAVVKDPIIDFRQRLAENIKALRVVDEQLDHDSAQWRTSLPPDGATVVSGMSIEYGISEHDIENAIVPDSISEKARTSCPDSLMYLRQKIISAQAGYRAAIRDQLQSEEGDSIKATHRRYDYGSFVDGWLDALAEQDMLVSLLDKEDA